MLQEEKERFLKVIRQRVNESISDELSTMKKEMADLKSEIKELKNNIAKSPIKEGLNNEL